MEKIAALVANFSSGQRISVVVLFFMLMTGIVYYSFIDTSERPVVTIPGSQVAVDSVSAKPVMPKGYQPEVAVRDPFLPPSEYRQKDDNKGNQTNNLISSTNVPSGANGSKRSVSKRPDASPELVGMVGGGGAKVAIIRYDQGSRSYQVGDYIGPYRLANMDDDSATLWGPDGRLVLILKGDKIGNN